MSAPGSRALAWMCSAMGPPCWRTIFSQDTAMWKGVIDAAKIKVE